MEVPLIGEEFQMMLMNLNEWSILTSEEKTAWLKDQSEMSLQNLLKVITDLLHDTIVLNDQLRTIELTSNLIILRDFTYDTLCDVKERITNQLIV